MSLDINWSLLAGPTSTPDANNATAGPSKSSATNGQDEHRDSQPSAETLTNHLISVLNTHLASTKRPSFIGPIEITQFDFGSTAPEVEIKDIRDVWRAFDEEDEDEYDDDDAAGEQEIMMHDGGGAGYGYGYGYGGRRASGRSSDHLPSNGHYHYETMSPLEMGSSRLPSMVDWDDSASIFSGSRRQSVHAVGLGARGLVGGRDYLAAPSLGGGGGHLPGFGGSVFSHPLSPGPTSTRHPLPTHTHISHPPSPARPPSVKPPAATSSSIPSLQLHLNLSHTSDLTLTLLTSLTINYPSSVFMSLPLKLSITGLQLAADLVVAFDGERKRVHITILDDEADNAANIGGLSNHVPVGQRLLPEMRIDSEIGHSDAHVLRNVGKVERFIADVVRKTLVDELVFPNFHTIAL